MNRRQYLQAVGASFALPLTAGTTNARENDQRPVYYTISVPEINTQILHISIPRDLLNDSNYLWTVFRKRDVALNISRENTDEAWEILNLAVQTDHLKQVSVSGIEARRWDTLEIDKLAILTTGNASHGYLGVVGGGSPVEIDGASNSWRWDNVEYERVRVESTDASDLEVQAVVGEVREKVPIFEMNPSYLSIP